MDFNFQLLRRFCLVFKFLNIYLGYNQSIRKRVNLENVCNLTEPVTPCANSKNGDDENFAHIGGGAAATDYRADNFSTSEVISDSKGESSVRQLREKYFETKLAVEAKDS